MEVKKKKKINNVRCLLFKTHMFEKTDVVFVGLRNKPCFTDSSVFNHVSKTQNVCQCSDSSCDSSTLIPAASIMFNTGRSTKNITCWHSASLDLTDSELCCRKSTLVQYVILKNNFFKFLLALWEASWPSIYLIYDQKLEGVLKVCPVRDWS